MPPALQFVYAMLILIAEGNACRMVMAAPNRELEPVDLRHLKSELAAAWGDVSHDLKGFYEMADVLIVLDEIICLEVSNLARQLKFNPEIRDDHPAKSHLSTLWFRSMDLTITSSTSKARGPSNERENVVAAEKQLEIMGYRLKQERGRWPFLTPRPENATYKTRGSAPPLIKQIWEFLERQLEVTENREMTVGRFVTAANCHGNQILGPMLVKRVYGQSVLRERYHLRCIRAGTTKYAHQPLTGPVFGLPQIPVQYMSGVYVPQGCGNAPN